MNQKMVDATPEDIVLLMTSLGVTYNDAVNMIRDGINLDYIRSGFNAEIERDSNALMNEHRKKVSDIINEEFS